MNRDEQVESIRRWFGIYWDAPSFDLSIKTLLDSLPEDLVREVASNIWREAFDAGYSQDR